MLLTQPSSPTPPTPPTPHLLPFVASPSAVDGVHTSPWSSPSLPSSPTPTGAHGLDVDCGRPLATETEMNSTNYNVYAIGKTWIGVYTYDAQQRAWHVTPLQTLPGYGIRYSNGMVCADTVSVPCVETDSSHQHSWVYHQSGHLDTLQQRFHTPDSPSALKKQDPGLFQLEDVVNVTEARSWPTSSWTPCIPPAEPPLRHNSDTFVPPQPHLSSPSTTPPSHYSHSAPSPPFHSARPPTAASMATSTSLDPPPLTGLSWPEQLKPFGEVDSDIILSSAAVSDPNGQHRYACASEPLRPSYRVPPKLRRLVPPALSRDSQRHRHLRHRHHHYEGKDKKDIWKTTTTKKKKHQTLVQHRALGLPEIQYLIGLYLEPRTLAACVRVCRSWWLAFMPLLWNTITSKQGLSPGLTVKSLRRYGHLIRTAADISRDSLVQKFYGGQVRHLTELCVDLDHIRQAMLVDNNNRYINNNNITMDRQIWPEGMGYDALLSPPVFQPTETSMDGVQHLAQTDIRYLALDRPVSPRPALPQVSPLGQLLQAANCCTDIARRNPGLTRLEWAGLDMDPPWILNTDLYSRLPNLRMLYLKRWQVSQESFEWILQCCPQLETLVLDHVQCFGVFSDEESYYRHQGLRQMIVFEHSYPFLRHFPNLERLTVNVTDNLNTMQLADDIRQYCLHIKELEIDGTDPAMHHDIALLIKAIPRLVTLNLYCWFWSSSVVQALLQYHRDTIEVVNASDGAMDRDGNLYLNHTLGEEDGAASSAVEQQEEIQLLLTHCRPLRVFKVPWHGLSAFEGVLMDQQQQQHQEGRGIGHGLASSDQCGQDLEVLWVLVNGMDAALEVQQLMTGLGAEPTTAKQRAWIAQLQKSRDITATTELAYLSKDGGMDWDTKTAGSPPPSSSLPRNTSSVADSPRVPHTTESPHYTEFVENGIEVHTRNECKGIEEGNEEEEQGQGQIHRGQSGCLGIAQSHVKKVPMPTDEREKLRVLLHSYLQQFPRLERVSLGTGEYTLPRLSS